MTHPTLAESSSIMIAFGMENRSSAIGGPGDTRRHLGAGERLTRNPLLKFTLRSLMWLIECAGCYLAGHRAGFENGYSKASAEYGIENDRLPARVHAVPDLVLPDGIEWGSPESISRLASSGQQGSEN
jgi:hypothetical protein